MSEHEAEGMDPELEEALEGLGGEDALAEPSEIDVLRLDNAELKNRLLLEMAEMENLRKRTAREKADSSRFAIGKFARDLLTVGDDLRRAITAVPEESRQQSDNPVATLLSGVEATERQLLQILERHGVRRFEPLGEKFDPSIHEALFELPDPTTPNGTVVQVIEAGYMIGERVLRPARVGVAKGGPRMAPNAENIDASPPESDSVADIEPAPEQGYQPEAGQQGDGRGGAGSASTDETDATQSGGTEGGAGVGGRVDRTA